MGSEWQEEVQAPAIFLSISHLLRRLSFPLTFFFLIRDLLYIDQAGLNLEIFLSQRLEYWDYRCVSPCTLLTLCLWYIVSRLSWASVFF